MVTAEHLAMRLTTLDDALAFVREKYRGDQASGSGPARRRKGRRL